MPLSQLHDVLSTWLTDTTVALDLAKRARLERGWRAGSMAARWSSRSRRLVATRRSAEGLIRIVLVRELNGWLTYFCTDPTVSAAQVLEVMANRTTIEQTFRDMKEVWGMGQQ